MYPGGKDGSGVWQRLVNEIPQHRVFVSPFLGDCAVMRHIRRAELSVGIDLDSVALSRFRAAWPSVGGGRLELHRCSGWEWLAYAFDRYEYWAAGVGGGTRCKLLGSTEAAPVDAAGDDGPVVARFGVPAALVFVYADPPYLAASRRSSKRVYRCEMSEDDHWNWLGVACDLRCPVMISHYPCDLYDERLADWRSFEFLAGTRRGAALEKVWMNYPEPELLHDSRWLGRDKREREKFRRRRRTLVRKLAPLSARERQSVLEALAEVPPVRTRSEPGGCAIGTD